VKINRLFKQAGLRSDTKVQFFVVIVLPHFCMEVKPVIRTNQRVARPIAKTAQCEGNAVDATKNKIYGRRQVKLTLQPAMKAHRRNRGTALLFL
jgi:hypothetical protein